MVLQIINRVPSASRPELAALPTISRPQPLINVDVERSRVSHLPRFARVDDYVVRGSLPISTGHSDRTTLNIAQGLSYRNAALHVLLHIPIFYNFVRAHCRSLPAKRCRIENCLTCRFGSIAAIYWTISADEDININVRNAKLAEHVATFWLTCLESFWGPLANTSEKVGPTSENDEFYTESFLLHLLVAIRRQLEANPAEHQTFQRVFSTDILRSRKCSNSVCKWASSAFRLEQSLFLYINVQKPIGKVPHTDILAGLKVGIEQEPRGMSTRKGSMNAALKCPMCNLPTVLSAKIVNYPEVMILVRNMDQLAPGDRPDIPIKEELHMKSLGSEEKLYHLVSGASEIQVSQTMTRSVAFARGVRQTTWRNWHYFNYDGQEDLLQDLTRLDEYQRPHTLGQQGSQVIREGFMFPELFVYARMDQSHVKVRDIEYMNALASFGARDPPVITDLARDNELISRSITEIFTQRMGRGLLKFKIQLAPADPDPHDSIPFSLDIEYENGNCQWSPEGRIYGRLIPRTEHVPESDRSPRDKEPYYRFGKRRNGVATPTELTEAQMLLQDRGDGIPPYPTQDGFPERGPDNPFATGNQNDNDSDAMDFDLPKKEGFADDPQIRSYMESMQNDAAGRMWNANRNANRTDDWRFHKQKDNHGNSNSGKNNKNNKNNKHNNNNNGNKNNKNNRTNGNNNNNTNNGGKNNKNNGDSNGNQQNNGGGGNRNRNNRRRSNY